LSKKTDFATINSNHLKQDEVLYGVALPGLIKAVISRSDQGHPMFVEGLKRWITD
jgi:hypothetical protein